MAAAPAGGGARVLSQAEQDIHSMLAADVHLSTKNCDFQMERYVYKRRTNGTYIIKLEKTREKLHSLAGTGRVIVALAVENTKDITVQSARPYGRRMSSSLRSTLMLVLMPPIAGRHTPGTFTNLRNRISAKYTSK